MSFLNYVFLGIVQGLTEFLPISSSGHLIITQELLGIKQPGMVFEIFAHLGTLVAVFIVFRGEIGGMISALPAFFIKSYRNESLEQKESIRMIGLVIIASIPTAIIGFMFKPLFESLFESVKSAGYGLIVTGIILWLVERKKSGQKGVLKIKPLEAVLVGIAQGCAIAPGISRSGSTIAACLFAGINRETAAKYSFILSIPTILGAAIFDVKDFIAFGSMVSWGQLSVVTISAAISGLFAIKILTEVLRKGSLKPFSVYCWIVGFLIIFLI